MPRIRFLNTIKPIRYFQLTWLALCLSMPHAWSSELFSPLLTLRMGEKSIELGRAQLAALPQARLTTSTALQPEPVTWEGPLMRDVLALLDITPNQIVRIRASAWNDYHVEFTSEDFMLWNVILATRANGQELDVENFGPLRIIYPMDEFEELRDQRFHYRWVWFLNAIEII